MVQLDDLSDDCLMEVLEWLFPDELFKLQRLNKRVKRLATIKIEVKIKMISLGCSNYSDCCFHLGSINSDYQNLKLPTFRYDFFQEPSRTSILNRIFSMCLNVKSVDFSYKMSGDLLLEVIRRRPEIECFKFNRTVEKDVWEQALNQIGNRIVHITMNTCNVIKNSSEVGMMAKVFALKCPNNKQFDCYFSRLTNDFLSLFTMLPKSCRVRIGCYDNVENICSENLVDELKIHKLNWSMLGHRIDRLSSLKFIDDHLDFGHLPDPVRGVNFAALKKLDLSKCRYYYSKPLNCLIASRFPQLEEFHLNITSRSSFNNFDALFQRMASIKKLCIYWAFPLEVMPQFHRSVVNQLKNLETIEFQIHRYRNEMKFETFIQPLEMYVDEISSLKKLTVRMWFFTRFIEPLKIALKDQVKRMMMKQNRVKVSLIYTNAFRWDD